jgi:hypothetical protein
MRMHGIYAPMAAIVFPLSGAKKVRARMARLKTEVEAAPG